ncbi:unnamed protein product [Rotaria sp. Silwood1]|nr:unnamed protein product [Rotaria sp. Silwood1]CAF1673425.1 unnamed protein product [Rotaria sp. Silwood1]
MFLLRDFGSDVDRTIAKYLGKLATRLYIILFIIGLGILTLYTIVRPQTMTKTFDKPSFHLYNQLKQEYVDRLKCSCSVIASKYKQFVHIEAIFHQICTSSFTSDQWLINITSGLVPDLTVYEQRDYRRFLSAHLQYLQGLCQFSILSVNNSIEQFLTSLFITSELLSEKDFHARLHLLIEQSKSSAPKTSAHLLFLIRSINHANAMVSTYGTNFEYISTWFWTNDYYPYIPNQAIIYDNECSCGLYPNCTTQANFIESNSSIISIKGLKMGCTPSESLRSSTLECFYDQSCINLIQRYTNSTNQIIPLSMNMSRFSIDTTVAELINDLFVEQWATTINYSSYFEQCLPLLCSYTYIQQFNILYIITILLGLQGGLTIVLEWISPKLAHIIAKVHKNRKKRLNVIDQSRSLNMTTIEIDNINVNNSVSNVETLPTSVLSEITLHSSRRWYFKIVLTSLMLLFIIMALIQFSIYVAQLGKNEVIVTTFSTTMTVSIINNTTIASTTTTTITITTTHLPACQLQFQATTRYRSNSTSGLKSPVAGDFNGDNLLDVAFFNYYTNSMHVLIGDGKGNYTAEKKTLVGSFNSWSFIIITADFNKDKQLDLAFTSENKAYVYLLFGHGNGTFRPVVSIFLGNKTNARGIVAFDFNGDNHLDIAVAHPSNSIIIVLLGNNNGSFSTRTTYYTGRNGNPSSVAITDFNGDGYQDIVYNNIMSRNIGVLLGRGDGNFEQQKTSFTGGFYYSSFIAVGDFNSDNRPDVVTSYNAGNSLGVLLGYGNGIMGPVAKFRVGNRTNYPRIAVGDFNNDGHSDIVVNSILRSVIYILVGYGDGNFEVQMIFYTGFAGTYTWVDVADFNNDGCQDILASDDTRGAVFILLNSCKCQSNQTVEISTSMHP